METNTAYDNQLSEGTVFHEPPLESGRLEHEVDSPNNSLSEKAFHDTTRRSSRKIVKRKFFEEENCRHALEILKVMKRGRPKKLCEVSWKEQIHCYETSTLFRTSHKNIFIILLGNCCERLIYFFSFVQKCGETCSSESTRKLTKIELSDLQKSIIEKLTGERIIIDDLAGEQSLKALGKGQSNLAEGSKTALRRKRMRKSTKVNDDEALGKDQSNLAEGSKAALRRKHRRKSTKVNDDKALGKDQSNLAEGSKAALRRKRRRKSTKVNDDEVACN